MTAKQITELHNLCLQINLFAVGKDDAPFVMYAMVGNGIAPIIFVDVYEKEMTRKIVDFVVHTDNKVDREYRINLKKLKDIKKKLEVG